jgi:hypothetical protein
MGKVLYLTKEWRLEPMMRHLGKKRPALLEHFKPRRRTRNLKRGEKPGKKTKTKRTAR